LAALLAFMACDEAAYMTGATIVHGRRARPPVGSASPLRLAAERGRGVLPQDAVDVGLASRTVDVLVRVAGG